MKKGIIIKNKTFPRHQISHFVRNDDWDLDKK